MGSGENGKGIEEKSRYVVLYTSMLRQWDVTETIRRSLPEDKGTIFYPCVELWMGSLGQTVVEPMFPGYVFIRSDMPRKELHEFIKQRRREVLSLIKEIRAGEERLAGEDGFDDSLTDLTDQETELLDFMMGFRYEGQKDAENNDGKNGNSEPPSGEKKNGKRIRKRKIPKIGVLEMSFGYRDGDGKYVVMEGPLKGYEEYIQKVDIKERRAYLNMKVGNKWARVGLTVKSKKYWHPEDKDAPVVLDDGYFLDPKAVAETLMKPKDGR